MVVIVFVVVHVAVALAEQDHSDHGHGHDLRAELLRRGCGSRRGVGAVVVRRVAAGEFIEVQILLGAVAGEHLPDGAYVGVVGRDEALARAGFGGAGLADFGLAGLAGPSKNSRRT